MGRARLGPLCSVVIPTYNGRALLERCLESIARHRPADPGLSIEVIVADDASTDGTAQWLAHAHPDVQVVALERNGGFCAAANAGIAAARGRFIQLLNNDTEVTEGWIEAGLAPFSDPTIGSVAPLVLVRSEPGRVDSAGDSYALAGWPTKRGHGQPAELFAARAQEEVFGASGSSAFLQNGGAAQGRRLRSPIRIVLRGYRPGIPIALGRLSLPVHLAMRDLSRRLGDLRPRQSGSPAPHGPERGNRLLGQHATRLADAGPPPPSGIPDTSNGLAARPRPAAAVFARQVRCASCLARDQVTPKIVRRARPQGCGSPSLFGGCWIDSGCTQPFEETRRGFQSE